MKLFLGIDGGGTKTKVTVVNQNEEFLFVGSGGPSSIDTVSSQTTLENIQNALTVFFNRRPKATFDGVFAGLGGIVFDKDSQAVELLLKNLKGVREDTMIVAKNDMENALLSGLCYEEGMTLICGTGMVAFGKDVYGNKHKCGGWGYKEGDAGSGYDLGIQAIRHVIRAYDGRYERDEFSATIAKEIGMREATDIMSVMDRYFNQRTKIAKLSPIVTEFADKGNQYAKNIVESATQELALAVSGLIKKLRLQKKTLVVVGSLGNSEGYFKKCLYEKIRKIDSKIEIIAPLVDPAFAAAAMARRSYFNAHPHEKP
jgi:N-acetylglucosamine kinase-like BadF-type ATPase